MAVLVAISAMLAASTVLATVALVGARRREDALVRHVDASVAGRDSEAS